LTLYPMVVSASTTVKLGAAPLWRVKQLSDPKI
jgi:hypothetical protein